MVFLTRMQKWRGELAATKSKAPARRGGGPLQSAETVGLPDRSRGRRQARPKKSEAGAKQWAGRMTGILIP